MPLGKPTPDGEITRGSRHYSGRTLGATTVWNCPACGKQNDGRAPEQGCVHCGAGDPVKSLAGSARVEPDAPTSQTNGPQVTRVSGEATRLTPSPSVRPVESTRILRLLEYVVSSDTDVDDLLRRSLVGRMNFSWGTLTATIVDSTDVRQEDLLQLARKQPGVWLSNPESMREAQGVAILAQHSSGAPPTRKPFTSLERPQKHLVRLEEIMPELPDTGPAYSPLQVEMAKAINQICGHQITYTLALGLSQIAEELAANMEPEKFMTRDDALALANALMQTIPAEWQPSPAGAEDETPVSVHDARD